jgi:hypothetical protein
MLFAGVILILVAAKLCIVNIPWLQGGYRFIDYIGASLFTGLVVVFGSSAAWYFFKWISGPPPVLKRGLKGKDCGWR